MARGAASVLTQSEKPSGQVSWKVRVGGETKTYVTSKTSSSIMRDAATGKFSGTLKRLANK